MLSQVTRVVLAVALLAGWQASLEHPLRHADATGKYIHLHDGHSQEEQRSATCDAFAALTACAPHAASVPVAVGPLDYFPVARSPDVPRVADAPPFYSQGPPALA